MTQEEKSLLLKDLCSRLPYGVIVDYEQGEQKLADNIEPKFKVGDWVTDGDNTTQIVAVGTGLYIINRKDMSEVSLSTKYIEKYIKD